MRRRDAKAIRKKLVRKQVQEQYICGENVEIIVRDSENMNEYTALVAFNDEYLPKLVEWIEKRRYHLIEHAMEDHVTLKVDIFTFVLKLKSMN